MAEKARGREGPSSADNPDEGAVLDAEVDAIVSLTILNVCPGVTSPRCARERSSPGHWGYRQLLEEVDSGNERLALIADLADARGLNGLDGTYSISGLL
jgi:hypothetical protein